MSTNTPLLTQVKALAVGDVITVAISEHSYGYVRNAAYIAGVDLDRRYSARLNRQDRTCTITRLS